MVMRSKAILRKAVPVFAAALLLTLVGVKGRASIFFSTDLGADELVLIDSTTGSVTGVGPLGFDASDVDLITVGSRLFALNSNFEARVDLYEINPLTGASISSVQVHTSTTNVLSAEGLAQVNGQLKIGFRVDPAPFAARSNALGDLGLDGLIANVQTNAFSFTNPGLDFDGLGVNEATNQLYGSDGRPFGRDNDTDFFTVAESPLSVNVFHTHTESPAIAIDDIVIQDNTVFAMGIQHLYLLNLTTSGFSSVPLEASGDFSGLAFASSTDVPEFSSAVIWSLGGMACLAGQSLRRRVKRECPRK